MKSRRRPLTDDEAWIVSHNVGMAWSMTYELRSRHERYRRWDFDELLSLCHEGLCIAVQLYDPAAAMLSTYAGYWMINVVRRAVVNDGFIRTPAWTYGKGGDPELKAQADRMRKLKVHFVEPRGAWFADLEDDPDRDEEEMVRLSGAIERLPERERQVIRWRLDGVNRPEMGLLLGMTKDRVRKIEERARKFLRLDMDGGRKAVTS